MINPKNICVSACIGFFLSFFIGLFSDVRFSHIMIRAFVFALVFAALCVGITFLYQKFLSSDTGGFSGETEQTASKPAGGVVNIVVDDARLTDDDMSPKFTVLNNHSPIDNPSKSSESSVPASVSEHAASESSDATDAVAVTDSDSSFKPMDLNIVAQKSSGQVESAVEEKSEASAAATEPSNLAAVSDDSSSNTSASDKLDDLPDINSMSTEVDEPVSFSGGNDDDVIQDSDFASGGAPMKEQPISGDTSVMAKAIQTLLAKDNS